MKKLKIGSILHLTILDHADKVEDDPPGALVFEVFGRLVYEDKDSIELQWWGSENGIVDTNTDRVCIVKSAIKKCRRLK
jgi:hypothetical protein